MAIPCQIAVSGCHAALGSLSNFMICCSEGKMGVRSCRFVYLCKAAARLEMALCNYAFQKVVDKGYSPVCTPDLVKSAVLQRCGFQPRAENTQVD